MLKVSLVVAAAAAMLAQQPRPEPLIVNDHAGFGSIFDGLSLLDGTATRRSGASRTNQSSGRAHPITP